VLEAGRVVVTSPDSSDGVDFESVDVCSVDCFDTKDATVVTLPDSSDGVDVDSVVILAVERLDTEDATLVASPDSSYGVDFDNVDICEVNSFDTDAPRVDCADVDLTCSVDAFGVEGLTDETEEIGASCSVVFVISPVTVCAVLDCTDFGSIDDEMPGG
jgi:hypothetical protein